MLLCVCVCVCVFVSAVHSVSWHEYHKGFSLSGA